MANRFHHRRMTADELSSELTALNLTAGNLMRLSGASRLTVENWLHLSGPKDGGDIPHWVAVLLALLHLPHAMETARQTTEARIIPDRDTRAGDPHHGKGTD